VSSPIAPTPDDLATARRAGAPRDAGSRSADAVLVGPDGITVLGRAIGTDAAEHLLLITLAHSGETRTALRYPPELGTGRAMAPTPDGGFVIAGEVPQGALAYRAGLVRLGPDGQVLGHGLHGPAGITGYSAVAVRTDGTVVAGGAANGVGWVTRATDVARLDGERLLDDVVEVTGLTAMDDGVAAVASQETSTVASGTAAVIGFDRSGGIRWRRRLPATGRGALTAIRALPDRGLAAVGHDVPTADPGPAAADRAAADRAAAAGPPVDPPPDPQARLWLVRLDAAGEVDWEHRIGAAGEHWRGRAITPLPGGGLAAVGDIARGGSRDLRVVSLDADGAVAWTRDYQRGYDTACGLDATDDGGLVMAGTAATPELGRTTIWVRRLDRTGDLLWERTLDAGR
jgi:hypothetical protein